MVKKELPSNADQTVLTMRQNLLLASSTLQKHIFNKNRHKIKNILHRNIKRNQVYLGIYDKSVKILLQGFQLLENKPQEVAKKEQQTKDQGQAQVKRHKQGSLKSQFGAIFQNSLNLYERTFDLFTKSSPLQKYGHLIGYESGQSSQKCKQNLSIKEEEALKLIKDLYRKYRVSNMFKQNILSKVRKHYIEQLLHKGYLRQRNRIISLIS